MKLVLTLVAAFALSSAEALARPSNPIARSAVRSLARHQIAMADVLTRPPSIQLAPTKPSSDLQSGKAKKFKLLLFNDSVNKREFVAKVLTGTIPEMTEATAVRGRFSMRAPFPKPGLAR